MEQAGRGLQVVGMCLVMTWMLLGAAGYVSQWLKSAPGLRSWIAGGVPGGLFCLVIAGMMLHDAGRRRSIRLLRAVDGCRCLRCRYALSGLGDEGNCPECGAPFQRASLWQGWQLTYPEM
jgi:hypothetical protein